MPQSSIQQAHKPSAYSVVVLGVSTGGVEALKRVLPVLPAHFPLPLVVVIHIAAGSGDSLARLLNAMSEIEVKEADEGELIKGGVAYLAPPNYHLLLEANGQLALSTDALVNFARPSIDVLFESAANSFGAGVIGVVLTGAASDGAHGLAAIKRAGGFAIVQDPADARMASMPKSALALTAADRVVNLQQLPALLEQLATSTTSVTTLIPEQSC